MSVTSGAGPVELMMMSDWRSPLLPAARPPQQAPASWRTAPTPPLPHGRQPPLLDPGARQRAFRPTCSSIAPAPPFYELCYIGAETREEGGTRCQRALAAEGDRGAEEVGQQEEAGTASRSSSLTPPASLRSHGSRPRPTRHNEFSHLSVMLRPNSHTIRAK